MVDYPMMGSSPNRQLASLRGAWRRHQVAALLVVASGCGFDFASTADQGEDRPDGASPDRALPDGGIHEASVVDTVDPCGPRCVEGELHEGCPAKITACELGCGGVPAACGRWVPSLLPELALAKLAGLQPLVIDASTTINTDDGSIETMSKPPIVLRPGGFGLKSGLRFEKKEQAGAPELGVLYVDSLTTSAAVTIIGARPLLVVSREDITIGSIFSASATIHRAGPGGHAAGQGPGKGASAPADGGGGGGGGGYASTGGAGGSTMGGGSAYGKAELVPLIGGSGGGHGNGYGSGGTAYNTGGAGGGALAIFSLTKITITHSVTANGAPGRGADGNAQGGGGGGSGGAVLIEAPSLSLPAPHGAIVVKGAGGGAGSTKEGTVGAPGNGVSHTSSQSSKGGKVGAGAGGDGSLPDVLEGADGQPHSDGHGGGGGASGWIRVNVNGGTVALHRTHPLEKTSAVTVGELRVVFDVP